MAVEISINYTPSPFVAFGGDPSQNYVSWAPSRCGIISTDGTARTVTLKNGDTSQGGQVVFMAEAEAPASNSLQLDLSDDPETVTEFYIAGKFDQDTEESFPSIADRDASILVTDKATSTDLQTLPLMVRVRKDADTLTDEERDRFLTAMVMLNLRGDFVDFQNMHVADTSLEIHSRSCFLPWHRLYLLDLERKLQSIDPSVSLPYWRFDKAAPNVFTLDFMGQPDSAGIVQFSSTNPLVNWRLTVFGEGSGRISRVPRFDTATEPSLVQRDEEATINLGTTGSGRFERTNFENFERMEGDPHGAAHVSFNGQISDIGRAPADPLFFMLHCNVDRLWAKWQWMKDRFEPDDAEAYYKQGSGPVNPDSMRSNADRIGNFLRDTLWPWNGLGGDPRPRTAPGTYYPSSFLGVPDRYPTIHSAIDYQGQLDVRRNLGFSYDDVPYDHAFPMTMGDPI